MKTPILILLASIATTFAQVSGAPDPFTPAPVVPKAGADATPPDTVAVLDSQIASALKKLTGIKAQIDSAKTRLAIITKSAANGGDPDTATRLALTKALESATSAAVTLEQEIIGLQADRAAAIRGAQKAKPVEPPRAGRNKKPEPAAADPFIKEGAGAPAITGENTYTGPWNCHVLFETFDLSREDFLALLDEKGDDDLRYRRVAEWMTAGRAKLTTFTALTARHGQRTKAESIDEVRFATEFDPPSSADDIASPTTFEVKNAGESLELEVTGNEDGQTADVNVAPRSITLLKFADELAEPDKPNSAISQPRFGSRSLTTNITVQLNHPRMIGTMSGATDDGGIPSETRVAFLTVRRGNLPKAKPDALVKDARQTRLEYTFFSLDRSAARDLYLAKPEPQACYDGLRALVGEKKARLEHLSSTVGSWGNPAGTQETQEVTYATNWSSGGASTPQPTKPKDAPKTPDGKADEHHDPEPKATNVNGAVIPVVATTFEIKNTGFTSQAEPRLDEDGTSVDLNLSIEFVRYAGPLAVTGIAKKYPPQPVFQTSKANTSLWLTVGQQQFISTFNFPTESGANGRKDDGRVWFGFVQAVKVK